MVGCQSSHPCPGVRLEKRVCVLFTLFVVTEGSLFSVLVVTVDIFYLRSQNMDVILAVPSNQDVSCNISAGNRRFWVLQCPQLNNILPLITKYGCHSSCAFNPKYDCLKSKKSAENRSFWVQCTSFSTVMIFYL